MVESGDTVNSTMESHRQWRITRKDISEFLETYFITQSFTLRMESKFFKINKIRFAETLDPLTKIPS